MPTSQADPRHPTEPDMRTLLRTTPTLTGEPPDFDLDHLPADPTELHTAWLLHAIDTGVAEPHACVLSTVDRLGRPSARVLIIKDITSDGWWFASSPRSRKGRELAGNPHVAITSYWPAVGRQVRIRGRARPDRERGRSDLLDRPPEPGPWRRWPGKANP